MFKILLRQPKAGPFLALFCALGISLASAQSGDAENGELAAFGAVGLGAGTQPVGGGSAGVAFSRHGMVLFDFSFMPMGKNTLQGWPAATTVQRSNLYDFAIDFHVRVPVNDRWEPYAIIGNGLLWNSVSATSEAVPASRHYHQFNWGVHTGGGVRYFVGKNWGVRPEVKVIITRNIYTRISMGIFYVTPPDWP